MIGDMISKIRKEKGMTKTELARLTNINIGHLTHIEKGERNPSHKALRNICKALDIPYQQLMHTYDKTINEDHEKYNVVDHISYDKVTLVDNICGLITCPSIYPSSSIALRINDLSMSPTLDERDIIYIEYNSPLNNKDIGLFSVNDNIYIRRFYTKKEKIVLKADNKSFEDIHIKDTDVFYIIGKVLGKNI